MVLWHFVSRGINPADPLYDRPYIILYGTETCSICQEYRRKLNGAQQDYLFKDIEQESVRNELYPRMEKAGLSTEHFLLPVIDVNGRLAVQPGLNSVLSNYKKPFPKCAGKKGKGLCEWFSKVSPKNLPRTKASSDPLNISGITTVGDKLIAVVGGKIVQKGDKAGNYEVVQINPDSVEFRGADGKSVKRSYH